MNLNLNLSLNKLLEKVIPDAAECRDAADKLRQRHPGETPEHLARRAVQAARQTAAAVGAATGAASGPIIMFPAALADIAAVLRIEGTLAGVVAALLDPDSLQGDSLPKDVIGILFPGAVSQVLRQVGVRTSTKASKVLIRKYVSNDTLKLIVRIATRQLGFDVTRKSIVAKTVPLVGVGIGAGWNWLEVGAVGQRAIRYYRRGPSKLPPVPRTKRVPAFVRRVMPKKWKWMEEESPQLALPPLPPEAPLEQPPEGDPERNEGK
jgi:hypothetical protein